MGIGANEHFGQMLGVWNKWAFGEMSVLGQMGTLGPMSFGASEHLEHNGHFGANGDQEKYAPGQMGN